VKNPEQRCWNDHKKSELQREIERVLLSAGNGRVDSDTAAILAEAVRRRSSIKDLIEYSRAVHAEMEAIISVARKAASGLVGATLYTTTFPCHSCARHIVAAGVKRVFYIEPYERSLALELHGDSIALDADASGKVEFIHFEGVAPRQYAAMFRPSGERKTKDGMAVRVAPVEKEKSLPEYLDSYRDFESKVVEHWKQMGAILDGAQDADGDS
jgi:deoxycytidylate deaminase